MRYKVGGWVVNGVREVNDLNNVQEIPTYYFTVPLPKKRFSDF